MLKKSLTLLCGAAATALSLFAADAHDPHVPNEFIVYATDPSPAAASAALEKATSGLKRGATVPAAGQPDVTIADKHDISSRARWIRVTPRGNTDAYAALQKKYAQTPGVSLIRNTYIKPLGSPDDALYKVHQQELFESFGIPTAWDDFDSSADHQDVVVAVPDSGIHFTHPDLTRVYCPKSSIRTLSPSDTRIKEKCPDGWFHWDVLRDRDKHFDRLPWDFDGHGTAISGVIAGLHDRFGMAGVAPHNVQLLVVRVFSEAAGVSTLADVVTGLQYILELRNKGMPIKVVNCSWRTESTDETELMPLKNVIRDLGPDTLVVCAAGNSGEEVGVNHEVYPAMYAKDFPYVISVTSAQTDGSPAASSNYGKSYVDIAAPGVDVFTSYTHPPFDEVSGSSIAAAFVSAAAAIVFASKKAGNGVEAKKRLCDAAAEDSMWENKITCGGPIDFGSLLTP